MASRKKAETACSEPARHNSLTCELERGLGLCFFLLVFSSFVSTPPFPPAQVYWAGTVELNAERTRRRRAKQGCVETHSCSFRIAHFSFFCGAAAGLTVRLCTEKASKLPKARNPLWWKNISYLFPLAWRLLLLCGFLAFYIFANLRGHPLAARVLRNGKKTRGGKKEDTSF